MSKSIHKKQKTKELSDLYKSIRQKEQQEKREHNNVLMRLGEGLCLTEDMVGEPVMTILGRNQLLVNNYRSITEYGENKIRLQAKKCEICVEGNALRLDYFFSDEIKIIGELEHISYIKKKL